MAMNGQKHEEKNVMSTIQARQTWKCIDAEIGERTCICVCVCVFVWVWIPPLLKLELYPKIYTHCVHLELFSLLISFWLTTQVSGEWISAKNPLQSLFGKANCNCTRKKKQRGDREDWSENRRKSRNKKKHERLACFTLEWFYVLLPLRCTVSSTAKTPPQHWRWITSNLITL